MPKSEERKVFAFNRAASHNYFLFDKYEAGLALRGTEVKSIREGRANLKDSYAQVKNNEVWLMNCHISPYSFGNRQNHDPLRPRKLLLHKMEIRRLIGKTVERGFTLIPLQLFAQRGRIKCEVALAKGKHTHDKRESIRKKETDREARAAMRSGRK
ncbi:MAG: SsrA-binding protein SmpB [Acidobacteriia bacterium]|nr:SsrA-binding protein SmpB [Terriglobia bacterium]